MKIEKQLRLGALMALMVVAFSCSGQSSETKTKGEQMAFKVNKSEAEWKQQLTPEQYYILREKGTERPGTGEFNLHFEDGVYHCAACDAELFKSDSKFDAHCGWPSFDQAISDSAIVEKLDKSHGMIRTEIMWFRKPWLMIWAFKFVGASLMSALAGVLIGPAALLLRVVPGGYTNRR